MSLRQTGQPSVSPVLIVWVGVRALTGTDIRRLILTDLDLFLQTRIDRGRGSGTLSISHLPTCWGRIQERHRRWPTTRNPRLAEIAVNLRDRIGAARSNGWIGQVEGLTVIWTGPAGADGVHRYLRSARSIKWKRYWLQPIGKGVLLPSMNSTVAKTSSVCPMFSRSWRRNSPARKV